MYKLTINFCFVFFFFFKQKTAYGMRIIDWSSDVCSSDLRGVVGGGPNDLAEPGLGDDVERPEADDHRHRDHEEIEGRNEAAGDAIGRQSELGRDAHRQVLGAPDDLHQVVDDQDEGVADKQLHQHVLEIGKHTSELQSLMRSSSAVFCLKQ